MPAFEINFFTQSVNVSLRNRKNLKECLIRLINLENKFIRTAGVNVIFCDDPYLYELNTKFLKHNTLTDIITFSYSSGNDLKGDIFISIDRVKENAKMYAQLYRNELLRVIIHGFLHLSGYDDKNSKEKEIMTQKENFYLEFLKNND